jgi:hypothetical protein
MNVNRFGKNSLKSHEGTVPYVTKKGMGTGTVPPFWTKSTMDSASRTILYRYKKKKKLLIALCTLYRRYTEVSYRSF